jgi:hypothetical protein
VNTQRTQPPWEFLLSASRTTLQSYELSRLGLASNLRKEITALIDQWVDELVNSMIARSLIEQRERKVVAMEADAPPLQTVPEAQGTGTEPASYNIFPERLARPHVSRRHG